MKNATYLLIIIILSLGLPFFFSFKSTNTNININETLRKSGTKSYDALLNFFSVSIILSLK